MRIWSSLQAWLSGGDLGRRGERLAERHLKRAGYTILHRRQRSRLGEIDLVALDGQTIVFVEVKTRIHDEKGRPDEAIDRSKEEKLTRLALAYLKQHRLLDHPARFDVVTVEWKERSPMIQHYPGAFTPRGQSSMFS